MMKSKLLLLLLVIFCTSFVFGQIPETINYQGVLTQPSGQPVPNGNYDVTFRLYDSDAGGTLLWTESQQVAVENGVFNVHLGAVSPWGLDFDDPYWLSIQVNPDPELNPRTLLTSTPYSFNTLSTQGIQNRPVDPGNPLNGQVLKWNGGAWAPSDDNAGSTVWQTNGNDIYYNMGYVGIGTNTPGAGLTLRNPAGYGSAIALDNTGGGLQWRLTSWTDGTFRLVKTSGTTFSAMVVEPVDGYIGIGTSTPDQPLSVHTSSGISYIRVSDNTTGPSSGLRLGLSGSGNAYIINDESLKSLSLGTSGTTQMRINDAGQVGINQLSPDQMLHIKHNVANKCIRLEHQSASDYWENGVGTTTKNYKFYYNNLFRADISSVDGSYTQSSDRNLKKDIKDMESVLDKVKQLKPSTYNYIDFNGIGPKSMGFIAQDVEPIFPDLVRDGDDGYKGLVYDGFAVIAIKAIQEQQKIIEELQKKIEMLERR